jgi:uncharacterized damage-inducible protein DinB
MADSNTATPFAIAEALIGAYATNNRINLYLIENLPDAAWRAETAGGKGRNIAAVVAHMHNVRLMWLKAIGASPMPEKLDAETVTKEQATAALVTSWQVLEDCLRRALERDGKIKGFKPDVASFFAYLVAHDAHHRGQVSMLARQAGHPLPKSAGFGMWEWGTR